MAQNGNFLFFFLFFCGRVGRPEEKSSVKLCLALFDFFFPNVFQSVRRRLGNRSIWTYICVYNYLVPTYISLIPLLQFSILKGEAHDLILFACLPTFLSWLKWHFSNHTNLKIDMFCCSCMVLSADHEMFSYKSRFK